MEDEHNTPQQWQTAPQGQPAPPARRSGIGRTWATALTALGLTAGGMAGGYVISNAQTASPSAAASPSTGAAAAPSSGTGAAAAPAPAADAGTPGTFHSNENATHEAGESAAREAQENAGQRPTAP